MAKAKEENFQVSATGGAGTTGQYTGFRYGENKIINESNVAGKKALRAMDAASVSTPTPTLPEVTPINAETELPNQNVMFGSTPDTRNLLSQTPAQRDVAPDMETLRNYFPMMEVWANEPDTPQSTKEYVSYLRSIL